MILCCAYHRFEENIWAGVDSVIGDFLGGEDLARYRAERIQDVLGGAGIDSSVEGIIGATKDDILALWEAVGVDGKQAILDAYGAWKLLQEELAQTEIDKIIDGLGVSADELLHAYREINPEADNLVEAWRKTKSEIEDLQTVLDEFTGAAAKSAVDQLRADIAKRDQLRGVIDANNDTALNILAGRRTQEGVDALRRRERTEAGRWVTGAEYRGEVSRGQSRWRFPPKARTRKDEGPWRLDPARRT